MTQPSLFPSGQTTIERVWLAIKHLTLIDGLIAWTLLFLSKLAEPMLLASVVYTAVEMTLPKLVAGQTFLHNTSLILLNIALEMSAPGCFVMTKQANLQGEHERAKWARFMGVTIISLTILTLGVNAVQVSFSIASMPPGVTAFLLVARFSVAVGYSVVCRVHFSTALYQRTPDTTGQPHHTGQADIKKADTPTGQDTTSKDSGHRTALQQPEQSESEQQAEPDTCKADTGQRIDAYVSAHPQATQTDIARALGISDRTVRRHQSRKADTGQVELWEHGQLKVVR